MPKLAALFFGLESAENATLHVANVEHKVMTSD